MAPRRPPPRLIPPESVGHKVRSNVPSQDVDSPDLMTLTDAALEAQMTAISKEHARRETERAIARRRVISDRTDDLCKIIRGLAWQQVLDDDPTKCDDGVDLTEAMWSNTPIGNLCMSALCKLVDRGIIEVETGDRSTSKIDVLENILDGTARGTYDVVDLPLDQYELIIRVSRG